MSEHSHFITGKAPPEIAGFVAAPKAEYPLREKVDDWYFKPLRAMGGHEAFICLATCFALYEKYLRLTGAMPDKDFSQGHKVFRLVGEQINTDANTAYLIWNSWRNGLLHRAMPNEKNDLNWLMDGNLNVPVKVEGTNITINPWRLRDRILDVVESERKIWKDTEAPLLNVYEVTPLK
jgi:hypothetical protein